MRGSSTQGSGVANTLLVMNIVGKRKIFYACSGIVMLASIIALGVFGLHFGIDFTGGSILEVEFAKNRPTVEAVRLALEPLELGAVVIQPTGERGFLLRFSHIDETKHQAILLGLDGIAEGGAGDDAAVTERRFDTIGPTIGRELRQRSLLAVGLVILLIVSYIAFAFRKVSAPVASWKYGIITVVALLHDVIIPTGLFAVLGKFAGYEVDTLFVTAVLTILGFSVHDTIVVFDRVRENLKRESPRPELFPEVVNRSVNETFTRSINTSLTVMLALAGVYLFGGESTRIFSLTLIIGIIIGTYSSIFIASPLLATWYQWDAKRRS